MNKFFCLCVSAWAVAISAQTVVAPDATLQKLAGHFAFTEGPTCDRAGNLFFVDQPNDRIMEWRADGKLSTFLQPSGHANGMYFDATGNLIACADEHNQLWSIAPDKKVTVLIKDYQGKYLNGPNDVWVAPNGGMFITDPFYQRTWWDHSTMALTNEEVFYLSPDRKILKLVTDDLKKTNGITGTPDGKKLFVSDIRAAQTWSYDIQLDGSLKNKTLFCALGSDGMTIDAEGNLYLTGHGITVFDKSGKQIDHIDVPEKWTANLCFSARNAKRFLSRRRNRFIPFSFASKVRPRRNKNPRELPGLGLPRHRRFCRMNAISHCQSAWPFRRALLRKHYSASGHGRCSR